jgi:SAM-dependent methyltransferase
MKSETRQALDRINRDFYASGAALEFSRTRQNPWPGWYRVVDALPEKPGDGISVLDVGCGNGRFTVCLTERLAERYFYLGIDASETLLGEARGRNLPPDRFRFERSDFVEQPPARYRDGKGYDLILVSGVLHHVADFDRRRALLSSLLDCLSPEGLVAFTLWRFRAYERFEKKLISWEAYNQEAERPVDVADLEPGDHLLSWGSSPEPVRYCHFADEKETERLLSSLPAYSVDAFDSDGKNGALNHYRVLRRG